MKKIMATGLWVCLLLPLLTVPAFAQELIVGGQAVGIQIRTEGVLVAGLSEVETAAGVASPAAEAGLKEGDLITGADGAALPDAAALMDAIAAAGETGMTLAVRRGEQDLLLQVHPVLSAEGRPMLGILLRDGLSGIGTMTFCDPASGRFGALGHSISDAGTGLRVPIREGSITDAQIVGVKTGAAGDPGELNGLADLGAVLGNIDRNTGDGIFGFLLTSPDGRRLETGSITAAGVRGGGQPGLPGRGGRARHAVGDGRGAAAPHRRHRPGHERQPHHSERPSGGRGDACVCLQPRPGLRRLHPGHAGKRGDDRAGGIKTPAGCRLHPAGVFMPGRFFEPPSR